MKNNKMSKADQTKMYNMIVRHYDADKKYRNNRELPEMWDKYERFYRNDYWRGSGRPSHLSRLTSNLLFEAVEAMLPVVVSRPPAPEVLPKPSEVPREQMDAMELYAKQVQRELMVIWRDTDMGSKLHQAYREHSVKGKMIMKSVYDKDKKEIVNEICDLLTIYPDRFASTIEDCHESHLIHAQYTKIADIKDKYGISVEPEGDFDENDNFLHYSDLKGGGISNAVGRVRDYITGEEHKSEGRSLVIEYYCGDPDKEMADYEDYDYDNDGKKVRDGEGNAVKVTKKRRKYPKGKVVTVVRNYKDSVVDIRPNPYNRLPFFDTTNHKRVGDFWGISDGQNVETHILAINQAMSNRNDNLRFLGNPDVEVVEGSGITEITNEPGAVYHSAIPNGIRKLQPPPMGSDSPRFIDDMRQDADRIIGISDAFRGQSMSGDSGVKTQALISQATGRLQPKVQSFIGLSRELFEHWAWIIQNFYPDTVVQQVQDGEELENMKFETFHPQSGRDIPLKVDVSTMSMLPFDKYAEFQEAQVLLQAGAISQEQFVDLAPSLRDKQRAKEFVRAERQKQEEAMQMQQQALAQQQEQAAEAESGKKAGISPEEQEILQGSDPSAIAQVLAKHPEYGA